VLLALLRSLCMEVAASAPQIMGWLSAIGPDMAKLLAVIALH